MTADAETRVWRPGPRARAVFDAVFVTVGLAYLVAAIDLGVGTMEQPGSGAIPALAASLLVLTLTVDLVMLLITGSLHTVGSGRVSLRVVLVLASIGVYLVGVGILGHAIMGTIMFAMLLLVLGNRSWWKIAIIATVAGLGTDFLFTALLGLDLPTGVIEFGVDEWM